MNVVFLGLGGNLGDRFKNLKEAILEIGRECGKITAHSSVYETEAWGSDSQKKYLNMVLKLSTNLSPEALIKKTSAIEQKLGRTRNENKNSDRNIDVDILFFNEELINLKHIQIPHPRLHLRKFVLIPMGEIEVNFTHPVLKKTVKELLSSCTDTLQVSLFVNT